MESFPAVTLENQAWRADIVPGLNARVVRMIDKSNGRDALRQVPAGEGGYPNASGQVATVHSDLYAKAQDVTWSVESKSADRLTLVGRGLNGMKVVRTFELTGSGLRPSAVAQNTSDAPLMAAIQMRVEFAPGDIDGAGMAFVRGSGERVQRKFIVAGEPPTGKETWDGPDRPAGEWRLLRPSGETLAVRFEEAQAGRVYLNWTAKSRAGVTLGLWSPERRLAPGETLRLEAEVPKGNKIVAAKELSLRAGFDADVLERLWDLHMRRQTDNLNDLAWQYVEGIGRVLSYVNKR